MKRLDALRRWCGTHHDGRWVYEPPGVQPYDRPRPVEEIVAMLDKRTLDELIEQARNALEQIQCRANCGQTEAIAELAFIVRGLVTSLEKLSQNVPNKVRVISPTFATWPVNLSLNPQEIKRAREHLKALAVGTKTPTPSRPGQRVDPRNCWT